MRRKISGFQGIAIIAAGWLVTAPAMAADTGAAPPAESTARLYQKFCAPCHGENGDGTGRAQRALDPPPRNFRDPGLHQELTRERMIQSVTFGRPGTAMVGWAGRLSEDQITTLVDYIRANFMIAAAQAAAPVPEAAAVHEPGQQIYRRHCAVCHGDNGNSAMWTKASLNPPPRDFTSAQARAELTRERMIESVTHGRPGTAMMSFARRLSSGEITAVVDYVRATFMQGGAQQSPGAAMPPSPHVPGAQRPAAHPPLATPPTPADMSAPFADSLIGNADAGATFYQENCYVCHGRDGDGRGPRAASLNPPPRNFTDPDARRLLNRPALFAAIKGGKPGTVMPAWGKVLDAQQIADVAEYVFQAFITPDKKKAVK